MRLRNEDSREFWTGAQESLAAAAGVLEGEHAEHDARGVTANCALKCSLTKSHAVTIPSRAAGGRNCPRHAVRTDVTAGWACEEINRSRGRPSRDCSRPLHDCLTWRAE